MEVLYERCAGLDVHKKIVVAARTQPGAGKERVRSVAQFGTTTPDLLQLVDWLHAGGVTHVAMESTGEFWKPLYNLLESEFTVLLVNPQHVKNVPGRKTDLKDAEWLNELLAHGLLRASFIPPVAQRDLRDLTRHRTTLVEERVRVVNRVQKLLEGANIKLASVASDVLGVSGRAMLNALVAGQVDPAILANLARGKLRDKLTELERALTGVVRPHHRFLLAQQLAHIDFLDEQIAAVSQAIDQHIAVMSSDTPKSSGDSTTSDPAATGTRKGLAPMAPAVAIPILDMVPGIDLRVAEVWMAELGTDMSRFPTDDDGAAWAGLAPGNYESAGRRHSGRLRQGNRALRNALIQAAWAAAHTKGTYLAAQYHRLAARRGRKRALVAVAHSIFVIVYHMLRDHTPYVELGGNYFDERQKDKVINRLRKRIEKLGYIAHIELAPAAT